MAAPGTVLSSTSATCFLALLQIAGVWSIWRGAKEDLGLLWWAIGILLLAGYGLLMALRGRRQVGVAVAAHSGALVVGALVWAVAVDGYRPDRWDATGAGICLLGVAVIVSGRRRTAGRPSRPR